MRPIKNKKNDGDLSFLGCTGYNYAIDEEKIQFWILFLASIGDKDTEENNSETISK